jgi:hypothetical protein
MQAKNSQDKHITKKTTPPSERKNNGNTETKVGGA